MDKTSVKILFFGRSNRGKEKGNLGHVLQIHVCRQISLMTSLPKQTAYFCKIRLRSQANIDQLSKTNAFIGVTSFNILHVAEKKEKKL